MIVKQQYIGTSKLTSDDIHQDHAHPGVICSNPSIDTATHDLMIHNGNRRDAIASVGDCHKWFRRLRLGVPKPHCAVVAP